MAYNANKTTAPIRGLVNAGADLLTHMYDVKIYFPSANGQPDDDPFQSYPITVRAEGFDIPDVGVGTYEIKYHGISIKRPNATLDLERTFSITFREDAAFNLRRRFSGWLAAVGDPVTGGVSNATSWFGKVEVGTVYGAYFAGSMNSPTGLGKGSSAGDNDIQDAYGHLTARSDRNPLALWTFHNVWVSKVSGIQFKTDGGDANTFTVEFNYMDADFPHFGGNEARDLGYTPSWASPTEWTNKLD